MRIVFYSFFIVAMLISCNTQRTIKADLEKSLRNYNEAVRWHRPEDASLFPADSISGEYGERTRKARNAVVVDYRIVDVTYDDKGKKAEVKVEIDYYTLSSSRMRTLVDIQKWEYQEKEGFALWRLMSLLPEFP